MLRLEQRSKRAGEPLKEEYTRIEIALDAARTDEELHIAGDFISIASFDGTATTTYFKLNHRHSKKIYPAEIEKVHATYGGLYLTNAAEAGKKLVIYVGRAIFIYPSAAGKVKILKADGTNIDPAEDGEYDTVLDAIKTATEFSGAAYSKQQTSTNALVALGAVKLRDVIIKNNDAANSVDIGKTAANVAAFRAASYEVLAGAAIGFTQVNMSTLFILSSVADSHASLSVLGVEI